MSLARPSRRSSGLTLIELLAAMAVLALLTGISMSMIRTGNQRAGVARARGELAALTQALETYKQFYGDYPQTGNAAQATAAVTADIPATQAQSLLFNALIGVYGPTDFNTARNGPTVVELTKFRVEETRDYTTRASTNSVAVATGNPPMKQRIASSFLDPWGNRYLYYYKSAPVGGRPASTTWRRTGYLLYSAGPNGKLGNAQTGEGRLDTALNTSSGLYPGTTQTAGFNADNIYATP